ncbi:hypothetical protein CLF_105180 [Clonorchis sinensis]|uniref:Uncharacterized protein n=1 Tax=Clonorchis sinensis TaxID=79923 RepID=G7YD51_CLOSI|nr:hypothetical protein CLF_105180 [Clonorchis sinensis]
MADATTTVSELQCEPDMFSWRLWLEYYKWNPDHRWGILSRTSASEGKVTLIWKTNRMRALNKTSADFNKSCIGIAVTNNESDIRSGGHMYNAGITFFSLVTYNPTNKTHLDSRLRPVNLYSDSTHDFSDCCDFRLKRWTNPSEDLQKNEPLGWLNGMNGIIGIKTNGLETDRVFAGRGYTLGNQLKIWVDTVKVDAERLGLQVSVTHAKGPTPDRLPKCCRWPPQSGSIDIAIKQSDSAYITSALVKPHKTPAERPAGMVTSERMLTVMRYAMDSSVTNHSDCKGFLDDQCLLMAIRYEYLVEGSHYISDIE